MEIKVQILLLNNGKFGGQNFEVNRSIGEKNCLTISKIFITEFTIKDNIPQMLF